MYDYISIVIPVYNEGENISSTINEIDRKKKWELNKETVNQNLKIQAVRENDVPGTHIVTYDSDVDYVEIKHAAKGRQGLALGAVLAAEYIMGKKGIFTMNDLLQF